MNIDPALAARMNRLPFDLDKLVGVRKRLHHLRNIPRYEDRKFLETGPHGAEYMRLVDQDVELSDYISGVILDAHDVGLIEFLTKALKPEAAA